MIARELAERGFQVQVIDKRNHLAGNAYDYTNEVGIRVHKYGPHLFHTSNLKVVEWLSRFTEWTPYQHKVKALLENGRLVTLPVNKETAEIVGKGNIIDTFFRPYTRKMWGVELDQLDPDIINRVPIRSDMNELYFPNDSFQALPSEGYTKLIENIIDCHGVKVDLATHFEHGMESEFSFVFNSMPIDEYFNYTFGRLPYRSIKFHTFTVPTPHLLPVATVNFTHNGPFTRMTEWKNLPGHGQNRDFTTLTIEEPCDESENKNERYYPVKDIKGDNMKVLAAYKSVKLKNMAFIGRCGLYAYLDMHQAISSSLAVAANFLRDGN